MKIENCLLVLFRLLLLVLTCPEVWKMASSLPHFQHFSTSGHAAVGTGVPGMLPQFQKGMGEEDGRRGEGEEGGVGVGGGADCRQR